MYACVTRQYAPFPCWLSCVPPHLLRLQHTPCGILHSRYACFQDGRVYTADVGRKVCEGWGRFRVPILAIWARLQTCIHLNTALDQPLCALAPWVMYALMVLRAFVLLPCSQEERRAQAARCSVQVTASTARQTQPEGFGWLISLFRVGAGAAAYVIAQVE